MRCEGVDFYLWPPPPHVPGAPPHTPETPLPLTNQELFLPLTPPPTQAASASAPLSLQEG